MRVAIIGWYGTETLGDRAILAGLLGILYKNISNLELYIGSIYPFFTERTLLEDNVFYKEISGGYFDKATIFDTSNIKELDQYINKCDLVIMGGGPLCDIWNMYMVEYTLCKAKKMGKRTAVLGCGLGPLTKKTYLKSTRNILNASDAVVLRDYSSYHWAQNMNLKQGLWINAGIDPAAVLCAEYNYLLDDNKQDYIAVNARDFPLMYAVNDCIKQDDMNCRVVTIIQSLLDEGLDVKLLPMHCFAVGEDDRIFLNKIAGSLNGKIEAINNPPTLKEILTVYKNARFCVGMRFHSVVLQTMLNGNNYVIDYTHPQTGKIGGFLEQIGGKEFYKDRYINIQADNETSISVVDKKFVFDRSIIDRSKAVYAKAISILIN